MSNTEIPSVAPDPLAALLHQMQLPPEQARERLAGASIAIFGLQETGADLALILAGCGLRRFVLADPFPALAGDPSAGGQSRQALLAARLEAAYDSNDIELTLGPAELSADAVARLTAGCGCAVCCFGGDFSAAHHWTNRAGLRAGVSTLHADAAGSAGLAGPLVLPGRTACYMCYRMRVLACADDVAAALAHEQELDRGRLPSLHAGAVLPGLAQQLAGVLATTVLQLVLGLPRPALAGRVVELRALSAEMIAHIVLQQPDCPDCGGEGSPTPPHPAADELLAGSDRTVDLLQLAPQLISSHCGLVREAKWYDKDTAEPALPHIYWVTLANRYCAPEVGEEELTCWGKGLTRDEARASGLGEAVEHYAADWVDERAVVYTRRADLDGRGLDPRELVLYAPEQYVGLPYRPYYENSILGWVRGRSLVSGLRVYIPASAAFLGYQARAPEEYLFPATSNGMAAGASLTRAVLAAAYELLERDAFLITWAARLPTRRIEPSTHPDPAVRELCTAYARRGVRVGLWRLPTDHPCAVFLALAEQDPTRPGPAFVAALGADLDPAAAARKAVVELGQIRPAFRRSLRRPEVQHRMAELVEDPSRVTTMHDHALLYCSPALRPALDFLLNRPVEPSDWTPPPESGATARLHRLVEHFRAAGSDFIYYNLTPPDIARLGLAAALVIVPGLQPQAFGAGEMRLGGERLYEMPRRLGFATARLRREDLNPYPHPFD